MSRICYCRHPAIKWDLLKKKSFFSFVTGRRAMHLAHCVILALSTMPASACVEDMEWTDEEKAVMARAEMLRTYGRRSEATNMVAAGCVLPQNFYDRDVLRAGQLDVAR